MVKSNGFQGSRVLNSSNKTIANVYQANASAKEYFSLKEENNRLAIENAILHNFLKSLHFYVFLDFFHVFVSLLWVLR